MARIPSVTFTNPGLKCAQMPRIAHIPGPAALCSGAILALVLIFTLSARDAVAAGGADPECAAARQRAVAYGRTVAGLPGGRDLARAAMDEALAFCRQRQNDQGNVERQTSARHCEQLRGWLTTASVPVVRAGASSRSVDPDAAVMTLIEDGRFSAAFGKKYDEMTQDELRALTQKVLPKCFSSNGELSDLGANEKAAAHRALNVSGHSNNSRALAQTRDSTDQLARLGAEADNLQATEAGYARLIAMWQDAHALLPRVDRERREVYEQQYAAAEKRVALSVEAAMVERALGSAQGHDGLVRLMQLSDGLARASLAHELGAARDANRKKLAARANEIGAIIAATARVAIDAIGPDMPGLEAGVRWRREFDARYGALGGKLQEIGRLGTYFDERRKLAVTATQKEFREHLQRIDDDAGIDRFVDRYVLSSERTTPPGATMMAAVAGRRYDLEKRAVLGMREARQESGGKLSDPDRRAPTVGEMYDAISIKLITFAKVLSKAEEDCLAGAISKDAVSAITCIYIINAGNHGARSPSKISRLERIGCAPAVGKAGYMCDYIIGLKGGSMGSIGAVLPKMISAGESTTSRFVYSKDHGWVHIPQQNDR